MLAVISPAKSLDYDSELPFDTHSLPRMLENSQELIDLCRSLSASEIRQLMSVSDAIAQLNRERFQDWQRDFNLHNARQAIYAFNGDVYTGLDAYRLTEDGLNYAQQHLRMLSGLYGVLRPLDLMMAYRLEMGTKLANAQGKDLYAFWGDKITHALNEDLSEANTDLLLNLASDEYFKAVKPKKIAAKIIKPVFLDQKNGQYKVISFHAKKARGLMARFMIDEKIQQLDDLKAFNAKGYYFDANNSSELELVFKRDEADAAA